MIKTIKLHGYMGKKYGKSVRLDGDNMFQLMSGLISRFGQQFKEDVRVGAWHLIKGKLNSKQDIGEDELDVALNSDVVHLVPAVEGKSAGVRIVLGIVLIAVGLYTGQGWLVQVGAALAIGGVVEVLTKPANANSSQNQTDNASHIYNSATNVTSQGGAIPLIYGRVRRASSYVITADFSSDQVT